MEAKRLLIVDMDGTLVDTTDVNYGAYSEALGEVGIPLDYDYFRHNCNGLKYTNFLPNLISARYHADDIPKIVNKVHENKQRIFLNYLTKARLNVELVNIVINLRSHGYFSALVTSSSRTNCLTVLRYFNLEPIFDLVITQEDVQFAKPDPEGFLIAMKKFNIESSKTIIFEDSDVGIRAAKMTGANVLVVHGYN